MAVTFYSIFTFRESLETFYRKEKLGYQSCKKDICDLFKVYSFNDIWEINFRVKDLDNIRVIKITVQNSLQNLSSADGFRLIVCCNKKYQTVTFLNIYPKEESLENWIKRKKNTSNNLKLYSTAFRNHQLVKHDIANALEILE